MSNQLKEFSNKYYTACQNRNLQLDVEDELPIGEFDRYTLGVSFSGLDEHFLDKAKKALSNIEETSANRDLHKKHSTADLIKENPSLISLFIGQEIQSHEYFHLLQTLLLPSCYALYKASREMASLKVMIFGLHLQTGGKLKLDTNLSIYEYLDLISDDEIKGYLLQLFDLYKYNTSIVDNFFTYTDKESNIDMVDLMEGAAYFFQKLSNRTISIKTFQPKTDSPYLKAHEYFKDKGGKEDLLFIVLSHMSLKYGLLDDGDFMELMPTPQEIFESLCEEINSYENYLADIPLSLSFFGSYSPFEKLEQWGFSFKEQGFEDVMNDMTDEELYAAGKIIGLCNRVEDDVQMHFEKNRVKFKKPQVKPDDIRANAIVEKIRDDYPSFDSYLFLSLLLTNHLFASTMLFKYLPKVKDVEYKGVFSEDTNTLMDNNLYRLVNDIDSLLINGITECCHIHGKLPFRKLVVCESKVGLNQRVKNLIGTDLKGLFE